MATKFWIVDTFSERVFQGVPASVFFMDSFVDDSAMQNIAMEINTPETIFIRERSNGDFESVCFSPNTKGLFFGNALFAAAEVIHKEKSLKHFNIIYGIRIFKVNVEENGEINVRFSTVELNKASTPPSLNPALNNEIIVSLVEAKGELVVEIRSPKRLLNLHPNLDILSGINYDSFVITADTHFETDLDYDFCAKVYAPRLGVYHEIATPISCAKLASYWFDRMNKTELVAFGSTGRENSKIHVSYGSEFTNVSAHCAISTVGEMISL